MSNKDRPTMMFVHPEFRKKIKIQSAIEGVSMIKMTEKIAKQVDENIQNSDPKIDGLKKKGGFKFQW